MTDDREPRWRPMRGNPKQHGLYHPCCICGSMIAPFGVDVAIRQEKFGRWYCAEHRPTE